ncbi:hypothetical protein ACFFGH_11635 [Lysobacter korlensis]|uniref:DUF8129 domain-containing protein n=1 Tax=Lysobacter korlensis TaxID=553636 RepID=A0ABV6RNC9_9GAMM
MSANTSGSENVVPEGGTQDRDQLPLPDFDHIPLGTLPSRIHSLDERALTQLLGWERAHGNRLPVTRVLESRIEQLRNGAEPSGSIPKEMPEMTTTQGGSPVTQATARDHVPEPAKSSPMLPSQPQ